MNILDITNEDIERLKENKIVFGLLPERDREIFEVLGTGNTERYCSSGFFHCIAGGVFSNAGVYRINSTYSGVWYTEADIIAYLQASEVPPSQWHPAAQEWAKGKKDIWEFCDGKTWHKCGWVGWSDGNFSIFPHRLRADYGKSEIPNVVKNMPFTLKQIPPRAKKPEVCVWVHFRDLYFSPHNRQYHISKDSLKQRTLCTTRVNTIIVKSIELKQGIEIRNVLIAGIKIRNAHVRKGKKWTC